MMIFESRWAFTEWWIDLTVDVLLFVMYMYMHAVPLETYSSNCYSFVNFIVFVVVDDCGFYSFLYTFVDNN